ncbi:bacteriophytochrome BphP [soil metagenome]
MSVNKVSLSTVDLDTCDKEPIHIPGSIQPHGALIALDLQGVLTHASRNAAGLIPNLPPLGQRPSIAEFWRSPALLQIVEGVLEEAATVRDVPAISVEATLGGVLYDVVVYAHEGRVVLEFERREPDAGELASFAMLAHQSMSRLKGKPDFVSILSEVVATIRHLTGFDRVMAYRFHHDDSGEVVAEAKVDVLSPFLARRFPASDIPVQARRLYIVNTLRLIADVNDAQVPVDALDPAAPPLDMSHSMLRSVSPIHVEYLKNIDVAASMSISIVVGGKLWGLIACHHRSAHRVPFAIRMACDVLANVVSSAVQVVSERQAAARKSAAADVRGRLAELALQDEEAGLGTGPTKAALSSVIPSDKILFAQGTKLRHDGVPASAAAELLRWLDPRTDDLIALDELSSLPEALRQSLSPVSGILALRHDRVNRGWIVFLRNEQSSPMVWNGPPDKAIRLGPLGIRLTPDGSLAEWQQAVRGRAEAWDELDLFIARQILDELGRASAARAVEMDRARSHLLAILGHDLRDPLQSINMAALMLGRGIDQASMVRRISASSGRMGRLIAQVMDMSRLQGGLGLGLTFAEVDLATWVESLVEESLLAYPNALIRAEIEPALHAAVDRDRLAQVVSNLLANARQHGVLGELITIRLRTVGDSLSLEVANQAPPIAEALIPGLFDPLKRGSVSNQRNPNGLGLGLYIASEVAKGHGGTLSYRHDGSCVVFDRSCRFPGGPYDSMRQCQRSFHGIPEMQRLQEVVRHLQRRVPQRRL